MSHCIFENKERKWRCIACGRTATIRSDRPPTAICGARFAGVGTELTKLIKRWLRIQPEKCGCKSLAREMDARGVHWCEQNRYELIDRMMVNADEMKLKRLALLSDSHKRAGLGKLLDRAIAKATEKSQLELLPLDTPAKPTSRAELVERT